MTDKTVQRRLAAILVTDVVGYSRLMGLDEAGTLDALSKLRREVIDPRVGEHGGRIFKATGDGLMVEFPSVVGAVACAVAIQSAMARENDNSAAGQVIEIRIGINLGDVIIENEDVFGDGVNVAARLEGLAPAGGIVISSAVRDQIGNRLDLHLEDLGQQVLKNIAQPVGAHRLNLGGSSASLTPSPALPDKPSIAVLPFQNMSGDPEQEYFAEGMVEDITTALSRFNALFVIARNSSSTYKGRAVDVKQVGRELGVRYVLEGSVRKSGNRLRITGQLIETATGSHLWADRIDGLIEDVFALQDQVTASVVGAIAPKLELAEIQRAKRKPTGSMDAYNYYLRGVELLRGDSAEDNRSARQAFERATSLDPQFALAHAYLALSLIVEHRYDNAPESVKDRALACALTGTQLDPGEARCQQFLGQVYRFRGNFELALAHFQRAISINPNDSNGLALLGSILGVIGRPDEGVALIRRAMTFNPICPEWYRNELAAALYANRQYEESLKENEQSGRPDKFWYLARMAACQAQLGRTGEARALTAEVLRRKPDFRFSTVKLIYQNSADTEHVIEGFRKAGLPE